MTPPYHWGASRPNAPQMVSRDQGCLGVLSQGFFNHSFQQPKTDWGVAFARVGRTGCSRTVSDGS
jgi:hypothetical protein